MLVKAKVRPTPPALDPSLIRPSAAPDVLPDPQPVPMAVLAPVPDAGKADGEKGRKKQYLELGSGFRLAHKPGTTYSLFYSLLAERGHFADTAALLRSEGFNPNDHTQAKQLLDMMIVSIKDLETAFSESPNRMQYAKHKTKKLQQRAKSGEKHAKQMLKKGNRLEKGQWTGNLKEIISLCLGYYNSLVSATTGKRPKINKNGDRFREAGIVIRRFRGEFLMMFPQKYIDVVKTAILTVHNLNEDV